MSHISYIGTHIRLQFHTPSGDRKTMTFKIDPEIRRRLEHWNAAKPVTPPTRREIAEWLEKHGAPLDSMGDEPALEVIGADGNRIKAWYRDGQPHRDNYQPAYIETNPLGGSYEACFSHGKLDNIHDPAVRERRSDGSQRNVWYAHGQPQHEEEIPAPARGPTPSGP